ncbi:hypothetical protein [Spongiimicrobium sp. 2-473A-2-J]|uniref:hypothetical protein n=1 Tax=Eudoraea algarum TaxID=3417568 RepID=UPI003D367641
MELHLRIIGVLLVVLALVHVIFPKYFNWPRETANMSLINRQMMYVHTFFIAFTVFLMGLLCLTSAQEVVETPLGRKIALGLGVFWAIRFVIQLFGYSPKLWRGKAFETTIHIVFSLLWLYMCIIFFSTYFAQ